MGFGRAQDIRSAVGAFRAAGKPTLAWSESFGELTAATVPYYLAAGFDEIWLQPSGEVGLVGVSAGSLFLAEALDRLGVRRQFGTRHEYKSAANIFLERSFTGPRARGYGEDRRLVVRAGCRRYCRRSTSRRGRSARPDRPRPRGWPPRPRKPTWSTTSLTGTRSTPAPSPGPVPSRSCCTSIGTGASQPLARRLGRVVNRRRDVVALVTGIGTIRLGRSAHGPLQAAMGSDTVSAPCGRLERMTGSKQWCSGSIAPEAPTSPRT